MNYFKLTVLSAALMASHLNAATIVDQSVDATNFFPNLGVALNESTSQNFLIQFTAGAPTTLTGAAIYSQYGNLFFAFVNTPVVFRLRQDVNNTPDVSDLALVNTTISAIDNIGSTTFLPSKRLVVDLPNIALAAGTYWFGVTGDATNIGWDFDLKPSPLAQQLQGNVLNGGVQPGYALPFQLYGTTAAVPEPASWAMLIAGFGLAGAMQRRRRMATAL